MGSAPFVSVILCAYNGGGELLAVIEKIRLQTFTDYELILVDDGSEDSTLEVMTTAALSDPRIRVLAHRENRGLGAARRTGFQAGRGTYFWNIDVDDDWPEDALQNLVTAAREHIADLVVASAVRVRANSDIVPLNAPHLPDPFGAPQALRLLLKDSLTGHLWNKLIHRKLLSDEIYTDARIHSDLIMIAPILAAVSRAVSISAVVYRYDETGISNIRSSRPKGEYLTIAAAAVRDAVCRTMPSALNGVDYLSFVQSRIVLSQLRDAVRGDYEKNESRCRQREARSLITWRGEGSVLRKGRFKDAVLLAVAALAPPLFRQVMRPDRPR